MSTQELEEVAEEVDIGRIEVDGRRLEDSSEHATPEEVAEEAGIDYESSYRWGKCVFRQCDYTRT